MKGTRLDVVYARKYIDLQVLFDVDVHLKEGVIPIKIVLHGRFFDNGGAGSECWRGSSIYGGLDNGDREYGIYSGSHR